MRVGNGVRSDPPNLDAIVYYHVRDDSTKSWYTDCWVKMHLKYMYIPYAMHPFTALHGNGCPANLKVKAGEHTERYFNGGQVFYVFYDGVHKTH